MNEKSFIQLQCRERTMMKYFKKWKQEKFNLRTEVNKLL